MHRLFATLLVAASVTAARLASASAPLPQCAGYELRGAPTPTAVPANIPAFALISRGRPKESPFSFTLMTKDGQAVASSVAADGAPADGRFLLVPTTPLEAGRAYVIAGPFSECPGVPNVDFTATGAKVLPTTAGTLRAATAETGYVSFGGDDEVPEATLDVHLEPSPELAPFFDTTLLSATLDEKPYGAGPFPARDPLTPSNETLRMSFAVICDDDHADMGISPGTHQLALTARVEGTAADLPVVTTSFTLDCSNAPPKRGCAVSSRSTTKAPDAVAGLALAFGAFLLRRRSVRAS